MEVVVFLVEYPDGGVPRGVGRSTAWFALPAGTPRANDLYRQHTLRCAKGEPHSRRRI